MEIFTSFEKCWRIILGGVLLCIAPFWEGNFAGAVNKWITIQYNPDGGRINGYVDSVYQGIEGGENFLGYHSTPFHVSKAGYIFKGWQVDTVTPGHFAVPSSENSLKKDTIKQNTILKGGDRFDIEWEIIYDDDEQDPPKDSLFIKFKAIFDQATVDYKKVSVINYLVSEDEFGILPFDTAIYYIERGDTIGYAKLPTYLGRKFNNVVEAVYPVVINSDTVIYMPYLPHEYKLMWNYAEGIPDGGTGNGDSVTYGDMIVPPLMTRENYIFQRWSPDFTGIVRGKLRDTEGVGGSPTSLAYTAVWQDTTDGKLQNLQYYTVKHFLYDTTGNRHEERTVRTLDTIGKTVDALRMEYKHFIQPAVQKVTVAAEEKTVEYNYSRKSYLVRWDAMGGVFEDGKGIYEKSYLYEKRLEKVAPPTRYGYKFLGWKSKKWSSNIKQKDLDTLNLPQVTCNQAYEAVWEETPYPYTIYNLFQKLNAEGYDTILVTGVGYRDSTIVYQPYDTVGFKLVEDTIQDVIKDTMGNVKNTCTYTFKRLLYTLSWGNDESYAASVIPGNYSISGPYYYGESISAPDETLVSSSNHQLIGWVEKVAVGGGDALEFKGTMPAYDVTYVPRWNDVGSHISYNVIYYFQTIYGEYEQRYVLHRSGQVGAQVVERPISFRNYKTPNSETHILSSVGEDKTVNDIKFYYDFEGQYTLTWQYDGFQSTGESYSVNGQYRNGDYLTPPRLKHITGTHVFNGWVDAETGEVFTGVMPDHDVTYVAQTVERANTEKMVQYRVRFLFEKLDGERKRISTINRYSSRNGTTDVDIRGYYFDTVFYSEPNQILTIEAREFEGFKIQDDDYSSNFSGGRRPRLRKYLGGNDTVFTFVYIRKGYDVVWDFNKPSDAEEVGFNGILPSVSSYTVSDSVKKILYGQRIIRPKFGYDDALGYDFAQWEVQPDSLTPAHGVIYKALWKGRPEIDTTTYVRYCAGNIASFDLKYMDYVKDVKIDFIDPAVDELFVSENADRLKVYIEPEVEDGTKVVSFKIPSKCSYGDYKFLMTYRDFDSSVIEIDTVVVHVNFNSDGILQINDYALVINDNLWKTLYDTSNYVCTYRWWRDEVEIENNDAQASIGYGSNFYVSTSPLEGYYRCECVVTSKDASNRQEYPIKFCAKHITPKQQNKAVRLHVNPRLVINSVNVKIENAVLNSHQLFIFSSLGQMVYSKTFEGEDTSVNMEYMPAGEYMIRVDNESAILIKE